MTEYFSIRPTKKSVLPGSEEKTMSYLVKLVHALVIMLNISFLFVTKDARTYLSYIILYLLKILNVLGVISIGKKFHSSTEN